MTGAHVGIGGPHPCLSPDIHPGKLRHDFGTQSHGRFVDGSDEVPNFNF